MKIRICLLLLAILLSIYVCGIRILLITSNSMRPALVKGDIIVTCKSTYRKGSIITFGHHRSLVTHRIVSTVPLRTKGDANVLNDSATVRPENIVGKACLVFSTGKLLENIHEYVIRYARLEVKK